MSNNLVTVFLFFLFFTSLQAIRAANPSVECLPRNCSPSGPEIRFPFRLKDESPRECGYLDPAFQLSCNSDTQTVLHIWPSSPELALVVDEIDYVEEQLSVFSPNDCLAALFSSHSLPASSPFHFAYNYSYILIGCSQIADGYVGERPPCLSRGGHYYYQIYYGDIDVFEMPVSCHVAANVELPQILFYFLQSRQQQVYTISLQWHLPGCRGCRGERCHLKNETTGEVGCIPPPNYRSGVRAKYLITGILICIFGLVAATIIGLKVFHLLKHKKIDREYRRKVEKFLEDYKCLKPTRYSYAEIKRMTDQFKTKLGQGGYGSVFKGMLPNGVMVAVKLLQNTSVDGDEFINEVSTIGRIHHVNIVRLLGFCAENLRRALVYEFMPNESLEKHIFSRSPGSPFLGWEKLQEIALGIARGIEYLHQGCDHRILHFDIKPHNVLLDHNFNPKISDFGLAKLCRQGQSVVSMTAMRGTVGYIAPEMFSRNFGNVSYKSDIYSFGMLLLEMVGGRKNADANVDNCSQVYFPEWIYNQLEQGKDLGQEIVSGGGSEIAQKLSIVGLSCIQWHPVDRPSMQTVVQMLEGDLESLAIPPNPFTSSSSNAESVQRKHHFSQLSIITE